ncbi:MAG: xanthine dehydrogenase family protein molybdopterin-binding subunit, partial [Acidimicrobiales bacterium]
MTPEPFFGRALLRREDPALLCGEALFLADLDASDALHAVFVRSSVAHGRLIGADLSTALGEPGVVAAFTAQDLGLPDIPEWPLAGAVQRPELARPCLARDRVRFVGEAVAVVVAASPAQAVDAAEQVVLDIDPLPVVVDPIAALGDDAPVLFPEVGTNLAVELHLETGWEHPTLDGANDGATDVANDGATDSAEVIVNERFYNQRLAPAPMEPNGALV